MKKYRWVLTAVFAAFLVGTSGCGKKTETIPITTISQSTCLLYTSDAADE